MRIVKRWVEMDGVHQGKGRNWWASRSGISEGKGREVGDGVGCEFFDWEKRRGKAELPQDEGENEERWPDEKT